MKIRVNWWKPTGKWAYCTDIEFPNKMGYIDPNEVKQLVVDLQQELCDEWVDSDYYVTLCTSDQEYVPGMPFVDRLYHPGAFAGMRRTET